MADDNDQGSKTEQPTGKRLGEAHNKGQFARSQEIGTWGMLFIATFSLIYLAPWMMRSVMDISVGFIANPDRYPTDVEHMKLLFWNLSLQLGLVIAPLVGALITTALVGAYLQVGWSFSWEKLELKWSAFNPVAGFSKLIGVRSLTEFVKGVIKVGVVGVVMWFVTVPYLKDVEVMPDFPIAAILDRLQDLALVLVKWTLGIMSFVAAADYAWEKYRYIERLKMTREEVKDENKQQDGDPKVKQRIAKLRFDRARARMMAAVAKADVVITNPTHYAVALKYDMKSMEAPKLVGKGVDEVAKRIREVADQNDIAIVENPPLARAIYASVELEQEIPPKYYHAVAEVISYVFRLKGKLPRQPGERLTAPKPDWSLDPEREKNEADPERDRNVRRLH
jgi:flagellar biosynthetic protein FlhB